MPLNKRLKDVLTTEKSTSQCASWLLDLCTRAKEAAKGFDESAAWEGIAKQLNEALTRYKAHRANEDPERTPSYTNLWKVTSNCVSNAVHSLNTDRPNSGFPAIGVVSEADLVAIVENRISKGLWWTTCRYCRRHKHGSVQVENMRVCPNCAPSYCIKCQTCNNLKLSENIIYSADGKKAFCKDCIPAGQFHCKRCNRTYAGTPSKGRNVTAEEMIAAGITACVKCAHAYSKLSCGHISCEGHRTYPINSQEDDQRSRDDVMNRPDADGAVVCRDCLKLFEADIRPDHWNPSVKVAEDRAWDQVGSPRTYGVEIEVCQARKQPGMPDDMKHYWYAKQDDSLPRYGIEMASTVLKGNKGLEVIRELCRYARENQWAVDARCGYHAHFGLLNDTDTQREAVAMGYLMTYEMWCQFVPRSRGNNNKYCRRPPLTAEQALAKTGMIIPNLVASDDHHARRVWVNWYALRKFGTVEIRLHHGTIVYEKIVNWIKAHLLFIDWCVGMGGPKEVYEALKPYQGPHPRKIFLALTAKAWWKDRKLARWLRARAGTLHGKRSLLIPKRKGGGGAIPREEFTVGGIKPRYVRSGAGKYYVAGPEGSGMVLDIIGRWVNPYHALPGDLQKFATKAEAEEFAFKFADATERPNNPEADLAARLDRAVGRQRVRMDANPWRNVVVNQVPAEFFVVQANPQ